MSTWACIDSICDQCALAIWQVGAKDSKNPHTILYITIYTNRILQTKHYKRKVKPLCGDLIAIAEIVEMAR
jgi:hypothetical protein